MTRFSQSIAPRPAPPRCPVAELSIPLEFGTLRAMPAMRPTALLFALIAWSHFAFADGVLFSSDQLPGASPEAPQAKFPVSERSQAAWIEQSSWLTERLGPRGLRIGDPIHIRIYKQNRELELFIHDGSQYRLYRSFPICDISGTLGPKRFEGDLQAPEGFYTISADRLHPHSEFHLAFNLGYPNALDTALGRTGSNIMIHGGCASNGCFAMTDYYMEQLYVLAEAALRAGQPSIGVEIYPFRMSSENLAAWSGSRWHAFWSRLKILHDRFEQTGIPATSELLQRQVLADQHAPDTNLLPARASAR